MAKRKRISITQKILNEAFRNIESNTVYSKTIEQYKRHTRLFVKFCRNEYDCHTLEECKYHIQDYIDSLIPLYTASTVHTYANSACRACGVSLDQFHKPIRHTSQYCRGRKDLSLSIKSQNMYDPAFARLYEFARRTGLRRAEIAALKGNDFIFDPTTGHYAVFVRCGKGKKQQYQLVDKKDEMFIASYFSGNPDDYVFSDKEMNNHLNLHALRALRARELYFSELKKVRENPDYLKVLEQRIEARWCEFNIDRRTGKSKIFPKDKLIGGNIVLRGNRNLAIKNNLPFVFNRTVLSYVSIVALSHWRNDVSLQSYILNVPQTCNG